ncbi:hypothetical protein V1505DRAFT_386275 [Lipomyces doorenjongii]
MHYKTNNQKRSTEHLSGGTQHESPVAPAEGSDSSTVADTVTSPSIAEAVELQPSACQVPMSLEILVADCIANYAAYWEVHAIHTHQSFGTTSNKLLPSLEFGGSEIFPFIWRSDANTSVYFASPSPRPFDEYEYHRMRVSCMTANIFYRWNLFHYSRASFFSDDADGLIGPDASPASSPVHVRNIRVAVMRKVVRRLVGQSTKRTFSDKTVEEFLVERGVLLSSLPRAYEKRSQPLYCLPKYYRKALTLRSWIAAGKSTEVRFAPLLTSDALRDGGTRPRRPYRM